MAWHPKRMLYQLGSVRPWIYDLYIEEMLWISKFFHSNLPIIVLPIIVKGCERCIGVCEALCEYRHFYLLECVIHIRPNTPWLTNLQQIKDSTSNTFSGLVDSGPRHWITSQTKRCFVRDLQTPLDWQIEDLLTEGMLGV